MFASWGREGVSTNTDKSGQGEAGGLTVSGHLFQCGHFKRIEGIKRSFHFHLPVLKSKEANKK